MCTRSKLKRKNKPSNNNFDTANEKTLGRNEFSAQCDHGKNDATTSGMCTRFKLKQKNYLKNNNSDTVNGKTFKKNETISPCDIGKDGKSQ